MPKTSFRSHRQINKYTLRRMYGNPWDKPSSSSSSSSSLSSSSSRRETTTSSPRRETRPRRHISNKQPKKSAVKKSNTTRKNVSFREPLERSASSSAHAAWHTVSSK